VDLERVKHWEGRGAQLSPTAQRLVRQFAKKAAWAADRDGPRRRRLRRARMAEGGARRRGARNARGGGRMVDRRAGVHRAGSEAARRGSGSEAHGPGEPRGGRAP